MKKKTLITEGRLRQMIESAIVEATSYPLDNKTRQNLDSLEFGRTPYNKEDDWEIEHYNAIFDALNSAYKISSSYGSDNRYVQKISEHIKEMFKLLGRWKKQLYMKHGEQPDPFYDSRHERRKKPLPTAVYGNY